MKTSQIISQSRDMARKFEGKGHEEVRLPVFSFEDWRLIYKKPAEGGALAEFRQQLRRNYYLFRFLRDQGIHVVPVPVRQTEFMAWLEGSDHKLSDGHETAHAIGDYVNRAQTPYAQCRHEEVSDSLGEVFATVTIYGETPDEPEIMCGVIHKPDGTVLATLEVLAADNSPQQAWNKITNFLDLHRPQGVFRDDIIRRPEFCSDCNGLLVSVADPDDVAARRPAY